jgi:GH25 family lysozyme M1 (1,4-beta-N-acetylmuramidase)
MSRFRRRAPMAVLAVLLAFGLAGPLLVPAIAQTSKPSVPTADSPDLAHGLRTLRALAGGRPTTQASNVGWAQGIDVASYQHPTGAGIDWGQVAGAGYSFAFVKATQGNYYANPYFATDYGAARTVGMFRSAYHFADPSASDGQTQADYLLNTAPYAADGLTLPPALDLEDVQSQPMCYGLSTAGVVGWIAAFSSEVLARTNHLPIIYTRANWWNQCTGSSTSFGGNPLWIADYGVASPALPVSWAWWTFWQWTSTGSVPGVSANVDISYFNGPTTGLPALAGGRPTGQSIASSSMLSWSPNRLDLFAATTSGSARHNGANAGVWQGWDTMSSRPNPSGVSFAADPRAVAWARNRLDAFDIGSDSSLWHIGWNGSAWQPWDSRGAPLNLGLTGGLTATSWAPNRLDIFAVAQDGGLYHTAWNGTMWQGWDSENATAPQGVQLTTDVQVVAWSPNRLDVFARGTDGHIWHTAWNGAVWQSWDDRGAPPTLSVTGGLTVTTWGPSRLDAFVVGSNNQLYHTAWNGVAWQSWDDLSGNASGKLLGGQVASVSWDANRLDVFGVGGDGGLYHTAWTGSTWQPWDSMGSQPRPGTGVNVVRLAADSWGYNRLDATARGSDGNVWHIAWTGITWQAWDNQGTPG